MQLCSFQALRVLTHFPLPDLATEHFYVWEVEHTSNGKIAGKFDFLWAMKSYGTHRA
jgi:hypothetical protein